MTELKEETKEMPSAEEAVNAFFDRLPELRKEAKFRGVFLVGVSDDNKTVCFGTKGDLSFEHIIGAIQMSAVKIMMDCFSASAAHDLMEKLREKAKIKP